jgi:hypothetical protein
LISLPLIFMEGAILGYGASGRTGRGFV